MLVFLTTPHSPVLTKLYCFVRNALLNCLCPMLFLIACILLWFHPAITTLLFLVIWAFLKMLLLSMLSLLSSFPNVVNGSVEKPYLLLLPQDIFCPPTSFSTIDMLSNTSCMFDILMHIGAPIFHNCGMILCTWNGVLFSVCVLLLNILVFILKIPSVLLSTMLLILLMMTYVPLNIPFVTHIDNFI